MKPLLICGALALAALPCAAVFWAPIFTLNSLTPSGSYQLRAGVPYGPLARQQLDIYTPKSSAPIGGWPVVVFFYGGSWTTGERASYRFLGEALASRGILTLIADYRLYPAVRYPEFLSDCAQALGYGMRQAASLGGNPKRLFVMGHSAGAYNAAMLALDPRWLRATGHSPADMAGWIGLAGPYDFLPINEEAVRPIFNYPNTPPDSQPITFVSDAAPPAFLGTALKDALVSPVRNTERMAKRLQALRVPVSMHQYGSVSHATLVGAMARPLRWLAPVLDDVTTFINADRTRPRPPGT